MDAISFSVVVPAYNTAATVGAAIASALAQTRSDFEVIVVDDGSTDDTASVIGPYGLDPRLHVLTRERGGPGAARNTALAHASGRYISMLDSDDLWLPTHLEAAARAFEQDREPALVYSHAWFLDDPPGLIRRRPPPDSPGRLTSEALLRRLVEGNFLVNSTVTVRREVLEAVGGCDEQRKAAVDFDLWLRIAAAGYDALGVGDRDTVYRARRGSIQNDPRNELRAYRNLIEVYRSIEEWDVPSEVVHIARARRVALERNVGVLTGDRAAAATLLALRRRAGRVKRAVARRRVWYSNPPPEVAALLATSAAGARANV